VLDHHALRPSRGARGVDHVDEVVGLVEEDGVLLALGVDPRIVEIELQPGESETRGGLAMDEDDLHGGVVEHVAGALDRVLGRQREVRGARLHDAEDADDHGDRALDHQGDDRARADAFGAQAVRELVRARIDLGVGERLLAADHRRARCVRFNLCFDELLDRKLNVHIGRGTACRGCLHGPAWCLR
jgi:hypothetical protein